jgi:hypothetical protein
MAERTRRVALPTCGSNTVFGKSANPGANVGSFSYTSSPAAAIVPTVRASTSAFSSTIGPRAVLTRTSGALLALSASLKAPLVALVGIVPVVFFAYMEMLYMYMQAQVLARSRWIEELLGSAAAGPTRGAAGRRPGLRAVSATREN